MNFKRILILASILTIAGVAVYYFYPISRIPNDITIDRILVLKSKHELLAFSNGKMIVTYKISIGKNPVGNKEYEGDYRTPEGLYTINTKNPNSDFYKNLGISYPNKEDVERARELGKATGGDIKLHGLKNGQGFIGKFQRWKD